MNRKFYYFRGFKDTCPSLAFDEYFNSRLDFWKIDIWQLGADEFDSEWNKMRHSLNCECRGKMLGVDYELSSWYFIHIVHCLEKGDSFEEDILTEAEKKIEEFAEPILAFVEKEGQAFWTEKEAAWTRIEQKAQEVNYEIKEDDFSIRKESIMNCRNEADLLEEEEAQINHLNQFQNRNHNPTPQKIQQEQQKAQERATQRQQKQTEQQQQHQKLTQRIVEEANKSGAETVKANNSSTPVNSHSEENKNNKQNNPTNSPIDNNPQRPTDNPSSPFKESPKEAIVPANKPEPVPKLLIGLIVIFILITLGLLILFANKWVKNLLIIQSFSSQLSKKQSK
ncbi:MAG: Endolytic murein transglycosylase [Mycoplasmataceae bacterium]|nr:MAG: Endolytic murein transglycosylase [Mycoplasmataceae bacterium]